MLSRSFRPSQAWLQARLDEWGRALPALCLLLVLLLALTACFAGVAGAPFHLFYWDVPIALMSLLSLAASCAALWDGALVFIALGRGMMRGPSDPLGLWRRRGFFSLGLWPWALLVVTGYGMLMSSNVTELNLHLIGRGTTEWRDAFFWGYEEPALRWVAARHWFLGFIDRLYVACWPIQVFALLLLMVLTRSLRQMAEFCGGYLVLYFSGRWIGCLTPVLGPIFFQPDLFGYVKPTFTQIQVDLMWKLIHHADDKLTRTSILKGGLSAMPSLHVAMVSLCGLWIVKHARKALVPVLLWVLATWYATVTLGWHYISDGAGGILLALGAAWVARRYFLLWR